jgi:hypothetical protein
MFKLSHHWTIPWAILIRSTPSHHISVKLFLIFIYITLSLFPPGFPDCSFVWTSQSPMCLACLDSRTILDLMNLTISGEDCKLWVISHAVFSILLLLPIDKILSSTPVLSTLILHYMARGNVRHTNLHTHFKALGNKQKPNTDINIYWYLKNRLQSEVKLSWMIPCRNQWIYSHIWDVTFHTKWKMTASKIFFLQILGILTIFYNHFSPNKSELKVYDILDVPINFICLWNMEMRKKRIWNE